jgi:C-methyltransferase
MRAHQRPTRNLRDLQETSKFEHPAIPMIDSVLKNIIHDWADDEAVAILENVRASTGDGARLILVESVIPPHHRDFSTKWLDLEMLVGNAGRERTADEYRILLQKAGFQMTRVIPTASPFSLVEAAPSG